MAENHRHPQSRPPSSWSCVRPWTSLGIRHRSCKDSGGRGLAELRGASFHSPLACVGHCADVPIAAPPLSRVGYGTHLCSSCTQPQSAPVPRPAPCASAGPAWGLLGLRCGGTLTSIPQVRRRQSVKFSVCPVTKAELGSAVSSLFPQCMLVHACTWVCTHTHAHTSTPAQAQLGLIRERTLGFVQCTDGGPCPRR